MDPEQTTERTPVDHLQRLRRLLWVAIIAVMAVALLIVAGSGAADYLPFDELPVAQGYFGGCNARTITAIKQRDLDAVRKLRARRAVGNCEETQWRLYRAIADNDADFVALLLAAGVDAQAPLVSPDGCRPPLAYAFRHRHDEGEKDIIVRDTSILKLLIDAGADIEAEWHSANCYHWSWQGVGRPLVVAVVAGDVEVVRLLIEAGADVGHRNAGELTALDFVPVSSRPENREAMTTLLREAMARQR